MKKIAIILTFVLPFFFYSCDPSQETGLSEEDIVKGLTAALKIGTDSSCTTLHIKDGYYKDKLLKILLPPEAAPILKVFDLVQGTALGNELDRQIENVILSINRSAEDAADDAKPIFINAITSMTITDGMNILKGTNVKEPTSTVFDSLAATHYLDLQTRVGLTEVFSPVIDSALNKDLGLTFSANEAWETLVTYYNNLCKTGVLQLIIANPSLVDTNVTLGEHATLKALDGLFYLVGKEESKIRKDPYQWADDIIQKVFGYDFNQ